MKFEVFVSNLETKKCAKIPNLSCIEVKSKKELRDVYFYLAKGMQKMGVKDSFDSEKRVDALLVELEGFSDNSDTNTSKTFTEAFTDDDTVDTKDWNLYVLNASNNLELLLERIRLHHLQAIGFYDRESLQSETKLQQVSKLLSISYCLIVYSADRNNEVVLDN